MAKLGVEPRDPEAFIILHKHTLKKGYSANTELGARSREPGAGSLNSATQYLCDFKHMTWLLWICFLFHKNRDINSYFFMSLVGSGTKRCDPVPILAPTPPQGQQL